MTDHILTEDALRIYWQGDEVPGVIAYGYWHGIAQPEVPFPSAAWPATVAYRDRWMKNWQQGTAEWRVLEREIALYNWPKAHQWRSSIEAVLRAFVDSGARVAWCGIEGHFVEPPALFAPEEMSGGVWAALSPDFGYKCTADLGKPFQALSEAALRRLRMLLASQE